MSSSLLHLAPAVSPEDAKPTPNIVLVGFGQRTATKALPAISRLNQDLSSVVAVIEPNLLPTTITPPVAARLSDVSELVQERTAAATVAYASLPHDTYINVLPVLFNLGIHVLKEKPLARSSAEAVTLVQLAQEAGICLGVAAQRRFSKRYQRVRHLLPLVGEVRAVQATERIAVTDLDDGWRARKSVAGGGVVLDLGYHMLDQLVGLFGGDCVVNHATLLRTREGGYDVEDTAHIHLTMDASVPVNLILSRAGTESEESLEIIGDRGVIRLAQDVVLFEAKGTTTAGHVTLRSNETTSDMLHDVFKSFLDENRTITWDCGRDLAVMRIVDDIYAVAQVSGSPVQDKQASLGDLTTIQKWSWPRLTNKDRDDVLAQITEGLSIYGNGGVFGEFEYTFKAAMKSPNSFALLHNSGTNALHGLYYSVGIRSGDEVIVPVYTFHATVSCLMQLGAKIVFVDALPSTGNVDPQGIAAALTLRTKAVIVTHMWGVSCDMVAISNICKNSGVLLLEDCAHAHGALIDGKPMGTFGQGAAWSIQGDKVISGGEGGVTLTSTADFYYRQLIHGHYNKRCNVEIPAGHPLRAFALTGTGLKNRAHPLAVKIALNQLVQLPDINHYKSVHAQLLIDTLREVVFLQPPTIETGVQPSWYALVFLFRSDKAPRGLTRERYVQEVQDRGFKDIDIPNSTRPLYAEALYNRPWVVLPDKYSSSTYSPGWTQLDFPGADAFHSSVIKLPVWGFESDLPIVTHYAELMLNVARSFTTGSDDLHNC